jgi:tRNA(fMet)-specific endonuclease VapC
VTTYLLDTNTVSLYIRGHPAVDRHVVGVPLTSLAISSISTGELLYGLANRPEATRLHRTVREFLRRVDVLPWDRAAAERYGVLRAALQREGTSLDALDMLIAAHALAVGAVLVTNDRAFNQVSVLQSEDWTVDRS